MGRDIGERIREEGCGIFYGSEAEHILPRESQIFGFEKPNFFNDFHPRDVISRFNINYFFLPRKLKNFTKGHNYANGHTINDGELFFFHYFPNKDRSISCIYTNFLGESLFVGETELIQEAVDLIKEGFVQTKEIVGGIIGEELSRNAMERYRELWIYDISGNPKYVSHTR